MDRYRVEPGKRIDLSRRNPEDKSAFPGKRKEAEKHLAEINQELIGLQELLYAQRQHKILVALQAMDTGGKDGTIRRVFGPLNPQGVRVVSFKKPTLEEMDRDFLWRIHRHAPGKGDITIFNRSHYEDVLVVKVHNLVSAERIDARYEHINHFERLLADEGALVLKFYLHITKDEQKKRLQSRLDNPAKHWKLSPSDIEERKLWSEYEKAYETALSRTSTQWAPWYVVPANDEWYRNLVVASVMVKALKELKMDYPKVTFDPTAIKID